MSRPRPGRLAPIALLLASSLLALLGGACGRKGPPVPPRPAVPADRGASGLPASAAVELHPPPPPPRGLRVEAGEGAVTLSWLAPAGEGSPVRGYSVYREDGGTAGPVRITRFPVQGTRYVDLNVENERPYRYTVRAVAGEGPEAVESEAGGPVEAMPEDRTPPASPRDLTAVRDGEAVRLRWAPGAEADLLGYRVYRRVLPDGRRLLLTPEPVPEAAYRDRPPGGPVAYAVTAVDRSRRRNESAPSAEVPARP